MRLFKGEDILERAIVERTLDRRMGHLLITNERVLFEANQLKHPRLRGDVPVLPIVLMDVGLVEIRDAIATAGGVLDSVPKLNIQLTTGTISFGTPEAMALSQAIRRAKNLAILRVRDDAIAEREGRTATHASQTSGVTLAPSSPTHQVLLHCRFCGNLSPPGNGRCVSCGAGL